MELHWQGSREERVRTVDNAARTLREYGGLYLGRWNSKTIERLSVTRSNRDAVLAEIIGAGWDDPEALTGCPTSGSRRFGSRS